MNYKFVKTFDIIDVALSITTDKERKAFNKFIQELVSIDHTLPIVIAFPYDLERLIYLLEDQVRYSYIDWLADKGFIARKGETYPMGTVFRMPSGREYKVLKNIADATRIYFVMEKDNVIFTQIETGQEAEISAEQVSELLGTKEWTIVKRNSISDGFGNTWENKCPECGAEMEVVRPGKVQCSQCG